MITALSGGGAVDRGAPRLGAGESRDLLEPRGPEQAAGVSRELREQLDALGYGGNDESGAGKAKD